MSKLTLDSVDWGIFRLKDIFDIENCKCSKVSGLAEGNVPYVGATNQNNGTVSYLYNYPNLITKGNCLVFICDGEGSMGFSFYKEEDFIGTTTVKVGRNKNLNKFNGMFISTVADTVRGKYNFGYKRNELRLKNETLTLPISSEGNPNWEFMEEFIKQEIKNQSKILVSYYENKLLSSTLENLDYDVEWKEFFFTDIFKEIKRGKRLTKSNQNEGDTPYVSSTGANNGVDNFISNSTNVRKYSNNLSLANSGSVGSCFYHYYEYIASDHVTALTCEYADEYIYKFMATIIRRLEEKYSFNREINDKRISREKLFLPIDNNGNPHWQYMSNFVKRLEKENMEQIIDYMHLYK